MMRVFRRMGFTMRMRVSMIMMAAMLLIAMLPMMMGRRSHGLSGRAFGAQVFFRIRAERGDAMLRAEEILAAAVRDGAGRPGRIDLHPAYEIREQGRAGAALAFAPQSL
jgi:hypothetical protein